MSTQRRRVIYMSDEMWAMAKRQAEKQDLSVSDWLRGLVAEDHFERQETARREQVVAPVRALLEDVLADRGITRPIEFRPVPKPVKRR